MADLALPVSSGAYTVSSGIIQINLRDITSTSTLDGDTVTLSVYEDTDGDGNSNNSDTFTVSGGTESFSAGAFDLSAGNEIWYEVEAVDGDSDITTALSNIDVTINY